MKRKILLAIFSVVVGWWLWHEGTAQLTPAEPLAAAGMTEPQHQPLYVYISGAVAKPGLYRFEQTVRVGEALESAGAMLAYADRQAVNLAEPIEDGQHIHIPYDLQGTPAQAGGDDGLISLNEADETKLATLPGIGPSMARRIIEHRQENGPFTDVGELQKVKGIGPAKYKQLQDKVKP